MRARIATPADCAVIARIYNEGIAERTATFETRPRSEEEVRGWFDRAHPIVAVEDDGGAVIGFASSSVYRPRECYAGIAEFGVYVTRTARRRGVARLALNELISHCRAAGFWKLLSRVFVDNAASRGLLRAVGFREVGTYHRHARLDGVWRDVVIVEKFLAPVGGEATAGPPASRPTRDAILAALRGESPEARLRAVDEGRELILHQRTSDLELIDAGIDAFVAVKARDPMTRGRFVQLFTAYASLGSSSARELFERLFAHLGRWSLALDMASFYEVLFVLKQTLASSGGRARVPELSLHLPELVEWLKQTIDLPHDPRARISPANLASLLMSVATSLCETEAQRLEIAELVPTALARHRISPPSSIRPPAPLEQPPPTQVSGAPQQQEPASPVPKPAASPKGDKGPAKKKRRTASKRS